MKYRLKDGYIEAEKLVNHYILVGPDKRLQGGVVLKDDFEARYEPIPVEEPAPPPVEEPESERDTYIYAIAAEDEEMRYIAVSYCFARSEDEATGIAYRAARRTWPPDTHHAHQIKVMKMEFEDN